MVGRVVWGGKGYVCVCDVWRERCVCEEGLILVHSLKIMIHGVLAAACLWVAKCCEAGEGIHKGLGYVSVVCRCWEDSDHSSKPTTF